MTKNKQEEILRINKQLQKLRGYNPPDRTMGEQAEIAADIQDAVIALEAQQQTILEQATMIEGLREAIDKGLGRNGNIPWLREYIFEVADNTSAQSLTAHYNAIRAEVAEECAVICESLSFTEQGPTFEAKHQRNLCAQAIRNMARKYKE